MDEEALSVRICTAVLAEIEAIVCFYEEMIGEMTGLAHHPQWQKGVYPREEDLQRAVLQGEMRIAKGPEGRIAAAMVVNHCASEGYAQVPWRVCAKPQEVTVIHLLAVLPEMGRRGIGGALVRHAIQEAEMTGQKAIRLDVLTGNLPARRLYERMGFAFVQRAALYYEDTGWRDFDLFELAVPQR